MNLVASPSFFYSATIDISCHQLQFGQVSYSRVEPFSPPLSCATTSSTDRSWPPKYLPESSMLNDTINTRISEAEQDKAMIRRSNPCISTIPSTPACLFNVISPRRGRSSSASIASSSYSGPGCSSARQAPIGSERHRLQRRASANAMVTLSGQAGSGSVSMESPTPHLPTVPGPSSTAPRQPLFHLSDQERREMPHIQFMALMDKMRARNRYAPRVSSKLNPIRDYAPFRFWDSQTFLRRCRAERPGNLVRVPMYHGLRSREYCNRHSLGVYKLIDYFLCPVPKACSDCARDPMRTKVLLSQHRRDRMAMTLPPATGSLFLDPDRNSGEPEAPGPADDDVDACPAMVVDDPASDVTDWKERIPDSPQIKDQDEFEGEDDFASEDHLRLFGTWDY